MRIAYIANIRFPTEKAHGIQIAKACEALVRAGETVELLIPARHTNITVDPFSYYGITSHYPIQKVSTLDVVHFGMIGFWIQSITFALAAMTALRSKADWVVYGRDELVLSILALVGKRNIFWESHDGTWNICSRYIVRRARGVVVVSQGLKDFYIEKGVDPEKIIAIPNGVDLEAFSNPEAKEQARLRLGISADEKIAMYIGRLDGWKGSDTLLEAAKTLPGDVRVVIIGGESEQIERLRSAYPEVLFLGFKSYTDLPNNQAAADVLVVPNTGKNDVSVRFTSPLKLVAHMASGRPIVASDLPSIRELVDESSAILVPADDPKALALGIIEALKRPEIAAAAFEKAQALDWSKRVRGIVAFLKDRVVV